ncbi:MAG: DNA polymerase III subunit gamma/tau, partial [Desulfobacterales bacterium]|nr:DNA polymerase III subunit gamma/tau [Desulfobacterales bacterium]
RTLSNAITSGRVAHAILFSGPRGTGKTTVARILAKAMNCKEAPTPVPCNICRSCNEITAGHAVDVYEIDGASNNSVDQIRELRENIKYMPAHSSYKIYIIDEVHMLSMAAFNALLKTLEEPPSHVMFIFATTEPHKIPITILSRCQRHDFRRISLDSISTHMASLCRQEGFTISEESLGVIAREAGGSMRDALSLLDQIMTCTQGSMSHAQVLDILGVVDRKFIFDISASILGADIHSVLDLLDDIYDRGHDLKKLYNDLLEHFRNLLVAAMGKKIDKLVDLPPGEIEQLMQQAKSVSTEALNQIFDLLFKEEISVRLSPQPKIAMEMALVRILQVKPALPIDLLIEKIDSLRQEIFKSGDPSEWAAEPLMPEVTESDPSIRPQKPPPPRTSEDGSDRSRADAQAISATDTISENPDEIWKRICGIIAQKNQSLAANLLKCRLKESGAHSLKIEVPGNGFTLNMLKREKNMAALRQVCQDVIGSRPDIQFTTVDTMEDNGRKKKNDDQLKQKAINHPLVSDAIEIFDGKLLDVKIL